MDKSTFDSSLESFRQNFDLFSQKTRQSYRRGDLPGFLYWYSLWRIGNPLNGFIFPDDDKQIVWNVSHRDVFKVGRRSGFLADRYK